MYFYTYTMPWFKSLLVVDFYHALIACTCDAWCWFDFSHNVDRNAVEGDLVWCVILIGDDESHWFSIGPQWANRKTEKSIKEMDISVVSNPWHSL